MLKMDILLNLLLQVKKKKKKIGETKVIILNTVKGKGIKEFENDPVWHARKINKKDIEIGLKRLI